MINGAGAFCVTASKDRTLKRWNLPGSAALDAVASENGDVLQLKAYASARAHEKDINMVSVAPNDSLIASASQDKTIKLWKSTDLSLVATLQGHRRGVWDCQFSPVDRVIASSSADRTVKVWSLSDFTCVRTFQGHVSSVLRIRFLTGGLQVRKRQWPARVMLSSHFCARLESLLHSLCRLERMDWSSCGLFGRWSVKLLLTATTTKSGHLMCPQME